MNITLYTIHCPQCIVLEKKLAAKNIQYQEITDLEEMKKIGINSVPFLQIDGGPLMNFMQANKWINEYKEA